jgi:hypothetical protein
MYMPSLVWKGLEFYHIYSLQQSPFTHLCITEDLVLNYLRLPCLSVCTQNDFRNRRTYLSEI